MRRILLRGIPFAGMLSLLAMAMPGCADNETMLFVRAVMVPDESTCLVKPDPSGEFRSVGLMDLAFTNQYQAVLLVGNALVSRGSKRQIRTESNRIVLKGSEVSLLDAQENQLIDPYTVPGSGFVDLGSGEDPGYGLIDSVLIPPNSPVAPNQLYIVDVKVFGETLGGSQITSKSLRYPIETCNGCLISFPADANDPAANPTGGYSCSTTKTTDKKVPCYPGEDTAIDCRLCVATNPSLCTAP
jgi:hypothetical protein